MVRNIRILVIHASCTHEAKLIGTHNNDASQRKWCHFWNGWQLTTQSRHSVLMHFKRVNLKHWLCAAPLKYELIKLVNAARPVNYTSGAYSGNRMCPQHLPICIINCT